LRNRTSRPVVAFAVAALVAGHVPLRAQTDDSPASELRGTIERFDADHGSLRRSYRLELSPVRDERLQRFYAQALRDLERFEFDALSHDGQVDYLLFKNHLDHEIRQIEIGAKARAEAAPLVPFAPAIVELVEARRTMEPIDAAGAAERLTELEKEIQSARRAAGEDRGRGAKKTVVHRAVGLIGDLRGALRGWFSFYDGYDPVFSWWAAEPYKAADKALEDYSSFLNERVLGLKEESPPSETSEAPRGRPGGRFGSGGGFGGGGFGRSRPGATARPGDASDIVGDPIGRDALLAALRAEMVPYGPEELVEIAEKELAWCESEMKKASRDLGMGDDWRKALEHVKTLHVEPGKQPELIRDLALEAIEFLEARDLVTIPALAKETWRMEMMSPERQLVNPFFTGGETISVSFPTSTMSHEQKLMSMRGNNVHFSRATVHHELIPGHHLQGFMTSRYKTYRSLFSTPFWGEGWALYWELFLWDQGFAKSPENRIGMLFWRMHRCARIIFSLGFHLEKTTPEECIDLLVNRVGHERENATAEVRRSFAGSYGPLYQAAYLLGGLQFYSLGREVVDSGKMTHRAFHDAILRENRIPVEMVRATVLKQKLSRDFQTSWRFYDDRAGDGGR